MVTIILLLGWYSPGGKTIVCLKCAEGTTTAETGATTVDECSECYEGYMKDAISGDCIICLKGTYSDTINAASCTSCPDGQTTPGNGSNDAALCFSKKNIILYHLLTTNIFFSI